MRKRTSRRRWKARIYQGKWVPWSAVVEHNLGHWTGWEHDFPRDMARIPHVAYWSNTTFYSNCALSRGDLEKICSDMAFFGTGVFKTLSTGEQIYVPIDEWRAP